MVWLPSGSDALAAPLRASRRQQPCAQDLVRDVVQAGGAVLCMGEPGYPPALTAQMGEQAPPLLFCRGNVDLLRAPLAAVVGTRTPSARGLRLARACTTELLGAGAGIVSGGADGVDTAAHALAIADRGYTVVVLPQGILTYRAPDYLRVALDAGRAAVASQFSPVTHWATHAAVTRNATIAALGRLVCVVEPHKAGGSMRTGRRGLEQGKPVFCVINARLPEAGHTLVRAGAQPLADDRDNLRRDALLAAWHAHTALGQPGLFGKA
jgi:DNA processing protein